MKLCSGSLKLTLSDEPSCNVACGSSVHAAAKARRPLHLTVLQLHGFQAAVQMQNSMATGTHLSLYNFGYTCVTTVLVWLCRTAAAIDAGLGKILCTERMLVKAGSCLLGCTGLQQQQLQGL